jgi:hypothetical protein
MMIKPRKDRGYQYLEAGGGLLTDLLLNGRRVGCRLRPQHPQHVAQPHLHHNFDFYLILFYFSFSFYILINPLSAAAFEAGYSDLTLSWCSSTFVMWEGNFGLHMCLPNWCAISS